MANAHNKQETSAFQDDLDAIFNNVNIEEYSDSHKVDDDFELLKKTHDVKENLSNQSLNAKLNQSLMASDLERPDLKLVKSESTLNRKQNIDDLLNSIADDNDFSFDDPISADTLKNDIRTIVANKNSDLLKSNDFDSFDEFGDIDEFGEVNRNPSAFKSGTKSEKPESLIDIQESLGRNFDQKRNEIDLDATLIDDDAVDFLNTLNDQVDLPDLKITASTGEKASTQVSPIIEKQSNRSGDEAADVFDSIKNNDFDEIPSINATSAPAIEVKTDDKIVGLFDSFEDDDFDDIANISAASAPIMAVKTETEIVDLFDGIEDDDFMPMAVDTSLPKADFQEDSRFKNGGFNEIVDDLDAPIAVVEETTTVVTPVVVEADVVKDNVDLEAKIAALWSAQNEMQQQIAEIAAQKTNAEPIESIALLELQSKEQKERNQLQELVLSNQKKSSKLLYGVAGVSLLSLLIGGGLLAYGLGSLSDLKALRAKSLVMDQELAALKAGTGAATGAEVETVAQLAEQVKNIRALLTGDKAVLTHGLHAGVSKSEPKAAVSVPQTTLHDIQSKADKSIRVIATVDKTAIPTKKTSTQWVANLLSVRQDVYAKQKAAEFAKQGIATVVVPIDIKGQTVYILRSNGFSTQDQALAYATQAKKALNLTSILVTPDE